MALSSTDDVDVRAALLGLCRVSKALANHEERQLQQFVEVLKHHLRQKFFELLGESEGRPVVFSYSADATPLKCSSKAVHTSAGAQVVRKGRDLEELLLQRGLLKTTLASGEPRMAFLFSDILPLTQGKKSTNIFTAQCNFFPLLRKAGHADICIQHICTDRALQAPLERMLRQRVSAYYTAGLGPDMGDSRAMLELTDWVVGTGCCAHDIQNALKWALGAAASSEEVKDLHIVIEALRNSFSILLSRLPAFLSKYMTFWNDPGDVEEVGSFWRHMGVEADMVDEVTRVNPWWRDGRLYVNGELAHDPDCMEKVSHVMLYLCRWRKFSDSRWCTMGPSCRTLLWGLCVGLEAWVALARADPAASDFFLHGFAKLSPGIKRYCAVVAMVAFVPDALLAEVLVDDRLVKHAARLQEVVAEELFWVESVGGFTWRRLAAVLGDGQGANELRHDVVHACHVSAAFIHNKVFAELNRFPWKLAVGSVPDNLEALAATEEPIRDSCAHKLRVLLRMGFNRAKLIAAVTLLQEVPWSSVPVEQAHASAAVIHRFHPEYGVDVLATRATLHQCRHFFLEPPEVSKEARESKKIEALRRKGPEKVSGKHAFLAHLIESAKAALPAEAKLPQAMVRQIVREHGRLFQELPPAGQAAFHREAVQRASERSMGVQEELQHLQTARQLGKARVNAELLTEGLLNRVPLARFSEVDYTSMKQLLATPDFAWPAVAQRRKALAKGPEAPPPEVLQALQNCPTYAAPLVDPGLPGWLKRFCWNRSELQERGVAIATSLDDGDRVFYFVYATQSPLEPHFKPLTLKFPVLPPLEDSSLDEKLEAWSSWDNYVFEASDDEYVVGPQLPCCSGEGVMVLQGLSFAAPGVLVSNLEPISLESFLDSLPAKTKEPRRKATQEGKASKVAPSDELAQHPWLAEFVEAENEQGSQSSQTVGPLLPELSPATGVDTDAVLDSIWLGLEEKRKEWELQGVPNGDDFTTEVRDWAWTSAQQGKAYFCVAGQAAKGDPTAWCRKYQLSGQASFSARLYGEKVATALSLEWCRRMQFFYDIYKAQPARDFAYTKAHKFALQADPAFLQLQSELPKGSKAEQRAQAIEALFPVLK